jgi:hypothetical protein
MEPKILYRAAVEHVPVDSYTIPLSKAEIVKPGSDLTIISYGQPLYLCSQAIAAAEKARKGLNIELIDLRTIYPWDRETVLESVRRTGRAMVVHESMINYGVGAEVSATIQEGAFLRLEAPVKRVAGLTTHTGLAFESFLMPDVASKFSLLDRAFQINSANAIIQKFTTPLYRQLIISDFPWAVVDYCITPAFYVILFIPVIYQFKNYQFFIKWCLLVHVLGVTCW